jgi:hypothetical protein
MPTDFLERLAEIDVPAPPAEFDHELHERLNRSLTLQQLADFALRALPCAALELMRPVIGFVSFTVTGKFPSADRSKKPGT